VRNAKAGHPHWLALAAIAIAAGEIAWLKQRFNTDALAEVRLWWAPLVRSLRFNVPLGLCVIGATCLLGRASFAGALREEGEQLPRPRPSLAWALAHLSALAAFYLLTRRVTEGALGGSLDAFALPFAWGLAGLASAATLACAFLRTPALARVARKTRLGVAGGLALGTAAFAAGSRIAETWPLCEPMARGSLWLSDRILALLFAERVYEPAEQVMGTPAFPVVVTKYCSGYEGVCLFLVFFSVFLVLQRDRLRFPQALLLLPLGALGAYLLNALRIAALVAIGTWFSPQTALDGFHVYAGWPLLCGVAFGSVALGTRISAFSKAEGAPTEGVNPTAAYLGPLVATIAATMIAGAISPSSDALYPLRIAPAVILLWLYRREYTLGRAGGAFEAVALGALTFAAWALLVHLAPHGDGPPTLAPAEWKLLWWPARILGVCAVTPLIEELAFRGYLMRRLVSADFEGVNPGAAGWFAIGVSSLAYGLLHRYWVAATVAGILFAVEYRRRGKLVDAVVAHAVANALMVAVSLLAGDPGLWG